MALPQLTDEQRKQALEKAAAAVTPALSFASRSRRARSPSSPCSTPMTPSLPA